MDRESATRALACLVVALVLASTAAGVAAASSSGDSTLAGATAPSIGGALLETAVNETTDTVNSTINGTTDTVDSTVNGTTDTVNSTVDETTDTVDSAVNETTDTVDSTVDGASLNASLEGAVTAGVQDSSANGNDSTGGESASDDGGSGDGSGAAGPAGTTETAADAVLVGMLGAITASGAAAGGSSASGAGGASTATAGWLRTLREADSIRRAGTDLWKLVPVFRYSQYDDSDPLEHDGRRAIYETIRDEPGCYLSQVSDRTEIPLSTVRYHVRVLEDEDLLTASKHNGKRRYFLEDDDAELRAALAEPAKREVLETLAALGRAHNGRLADELGRDPSTISHHLSALEDDGLVVRERDGRSIVNELPPRVETALADAPEASADSDAVPADD